MVAINGFRVSPNRAAIGIKTYKVPGCDVLLPVRSEVAPLLIGLARDFSRLVEPLRPGECWGYAHRPVRGGKAPSFHSAGIAIDLNAPAHPLGERGTFSPQQAATCRALARKYGFRWGGDYRRRADEMHFEIIVSRDKALDLVHRLQQRPDGNHQEDDMTPEQAQQLQETLRLVRLIAAAVERNERRLHQVEARLAALEGR